MKKRIKVTIYFLALAVIVLTVRLYYLQIMSGPLYAEMAEENIVRTKSVFAPRGNIYDRNGKLLVKSIPVPAISVKPLIALNDRNTLETLSRELGIGYQELVDKLESVNVSYLDRMILAYDINKETLVYFKENARGLAGVEVVNVFLREYSYGSLASHLLGYIREIDEEKLESEKYAAYEGGDQIGDGGVEQSYEQILRGIKGKETYEVDSLGRPVEIVEKVDPIPGNDIYLTVDIEIQRQIEELLYQSILERREQAPEDSEQNYNVPGGAVVVLEASSGEVIAMASYPTFNPEMFIGGISENDWQYLNAPQNHKPLNNRAVMSFAPGSTFKIATAYAGLAEEVINKNTTVTCRGVWYGLGSSYPKFCWRKSGHGTLNIYGGIKNSCDSYFYEVGYRLFVKNKNENELLQKYSRLFGFGSKTGIDLPYEDEGLVPDSEWKQEYFKSQVEKTVWYPGDTVNMSIGQGDLLATPLQLAQAYMMLANRGIYHPPHLVGEIKDYKGDLVLEIEKEDYRDIDLNEDYVDMIEEGLKLVVEEGTAAYRFLGFPLEEIPVAGKTGTSEVSGKQDYAWFGSYAPIGNPKYVVAVMLEEAGGGSAAAAPIAEDIYRMLFNIQ